jgi:hypothetical protein
LVFEQLLDKSIFQIITRPQEKSREGFIVEKNEYKNTKSREEIPFQSTRLLQSISSFSGD